MISGCQKCYEQEDAGIPSLRQVANSSLQKSSHLKEIIRPEDITYLEVFVGDTCNLKCVMCNPQLSSSWRQDYTGLGWVLPKRSKRPDFKSLLNNFNSLKEIKFVGGEPFLDKSHREDLNALVVTNNPSEISLVYYTNATQWPTAEILRQWQNFKSVTIWLSIDGYDKVNDYIRFPSKWPTVVNTVEKFIHLSKEMPLVKLKIVSTVSVYNIWSLDKLENWYIDIKHKFPESAPQYLHLNPLMAPYFMSIKNLPTELFNRAMSKLNSHSSAQKAIAHFMNEKRLPPFDPQLVSYTRSLDLIRKLNVSHYIPELGELVYGSDY